MEDELPKPPPFLQLCVNNRPCFPSYKLFGPEVIGENDWDELVENANAQLHRQDHDLSLKHRSMKIFVNAPLTDFDLNRNGLNVYINRRKTDESCAQLKATDNSLSVPKIESKKELLPGQVLSSDCKNALDKEEEHKFRQILHMNKRQLFVRGAEKKIQRRSYSSKSSKDHFMVSRIMSERDGQYLVCWYLWNFTQCTWQSFDDLSSAPKVLKMYIQYSQGMDAILKNLNETLWYTTVRKPSGRYGYNFKRFTVPKVKVPLTDEELEKKLAEPKKNSLWMRDIGLWRLKRVELEWLQVLDPEMSFNVAPLYLECLTENSRVDPPNFKFTKSYKYTEEFLRFEQTKAKKPHLCLVSSGQETMCTACANSEEIKLNGVRRVILPEKYSAPYIRICTGKSNCRCPGGWDNCLSWIPTCARHVPLVILHDPRYIGFGVRALTDIKRGEIITEYCGLVMLEEEAPLENTTYQLGGKIIVDATKYGNESRFFGHSCSPNLQLIKVYVNDFDQNKCYRHILVTMRDIKAGEDLTFDYHPNDNRSGHMRNNEMSRMALIMDFLHINHLKRVASTSSVLQIDLTFMLFTLFNISFSQIVCTLPS